MTQSLINSPGDILFISCGEDRYTLNAKGDHENLQIRGMTQAYLLG
jgi:hypothetical protein